MGRVQDSPGPGRRLFASTQRRAFSFWRGTRVFAHVSDVCAMFATALTGAQIERIRNPSQRACLASFNPADHERASAVSWGSMWQRQRTNGSPTQTQEHGREIESPTEAITDLSQRARHRLAAGLMVDVTQALLEAADDPCWAIETRAST
jgi:hypothetical protein